jgi:transposase
LGRSRGGWGSKLHLVTDGQGVPLAVKASAGQCHESRYVEPVMNAMRIGRRHRRPRRLAGDKGYSYGSVRRWLRRHRIQAVIPTKSNQPPQENFDRKAYRRRNVVERFVNWMKENRRLGTRYEKLAVNFQVMAKFAMIRRYFGILDSSNRPLSQKRTGCLQYGLEETVHAAAKHAMSLIINNNFINGLKP